MSDPRPLGGNAGFRPYFMVSAGFSAGIIILVIMLFVIRLSGGTPAKKPRNQLEKRNIDRVREGYSEKRRFFPKLRDKRANVKDKACYQFIISFSE